MFRAGCQGDGLWTRRAAAGARAAGKRAGHIAGRGGSRISAEGGRTGMDLYGMRMADGWFLTNANT